MNNEVNFKEQDPKKDNSNLTKISYPEKPRRSASTSSAQSDQMKSDLPLLHATIPLELELYWSVSTTSAELTKTGSVEEVINAQLNEEAEMMAPNADFADTKTNCGSADVCNAYNAKHEHLLVGSGTQPGQFVDSQRINADKNSVKLPNTLEFFFLVKTNLLLILFILPLITTRTATKISHGKNPRKEEMVVNVV